MTVGAICVHARVVANDDGRPNERTDGKPDILYLYSASRKHAYIIVLLCWGLTTRQPLWVILCRLPEKGRKEIEEIVEEMKERNREERGT